MGPETLDFFGLQISWASKKSRVPGPNPPRNEKNPPEKIMHGAVKFIGALIVIIKKSINQSACMIAEIERGRGGKSVFSPNKDLGTRVGD